MNIKYTSDITNMRRASLEPEKILNTRLTAKANQLKKENGNDVRENKLDYKDMKD